MTTPEFNTHYQHTFLDALAFGFEENLCSPEDFGSAVTQEDVVRAEELRRRRDEDDDAKSPKKVGYMATGWMRPGSDAMRMTPELLR